MESNNGENLENISSFEEKKNGHGGARPGAGKPKGVTNDANRENREALEKYKARVRMRLNRLINSQMALAEGVNYMYVGELDDKGKMQYTQITDPDEIAEALNKGLDKLEDGKIYFITAKDPDGKAIDAMLDRTFGKPKETIEIDNKKPLQKIVLELKLPDGKRREINNGGNNTGVPTNGGSAGMGENNT